MDHYSEGSLFVIDDEDDDVDSIAWVEHTGGDEGDRATPSAFGLGPLIFDDVHVPPLRPSSNSRRTRRSQRSMQTQTDSSVIDLTAEPDSPEQRRASIFGQPGQPSRNPRRTNSQRISPPRLERSDSTFFNGAPGVIDLTADSPEESRPPRPPPQPHLDLHDDLIELEFIGSGPRRSIALPNIIGLGRRFAGFIGTEFIRFPQPHLDISRPAFGPRAAPPSPKPPMEPVPPAREGFTRDTCADPEKASDNVVICPACDEELAYDPSDPVTTTAPGGGKKRKRAPGEHHFWAIKKCGHVYCAECFEHRRPKKGEADTVGFRVPEGKAFNASDLRCAVDGCDSKIANKGEWVGIFL